MNSEQLALIQVWFEKYVDGFCPSSSGLPSPLFLKRVHTRAVASNARLIACELDWSEEDIRMSEALGWLHDVGRFAQFAEFGHFHDAASVDHGLRGFEITAASGVLNSLSSPRREAILESIRHHNAKDIPPTPAPLTLRFLKLIRDADKLDIYRVVIDELRKNRFRELSKIWPHVRLDGPVNPDLLKEIQTRRNVDLIHVKSLADFLVLQAHWIYDLHYAPTRKQVRQRRILESLSTYLPAHPGAQEFFRQAENDLQANLQFQQETEYDPTKCHPTAP